VTSKLSELLEAQRLRRLWQRSEPGPAKPEDTKAGPTKDDADDSGLALSAHRSHVPVEAPHVVLLALEDALRKQFGASVLLLSRLLHPLRAAVAKKDPSVALPSSHPMQRAATGNLQELIDLLDDALTGLLAPFLR
jgi:hypothetical protein